MSELFTVSLGRARYQLGDRVEGTIEFHDPDHSKLQRTREVRVKLVAVVDGSGNSESVVAVDAVVHEGPIDVPSISFRLPLDVPGPVSFTGRHVKVKWNCVVTIDVAFAIDPRDIVTFQVEPRTPR